MVIFMTDEIGPNGEPNMLYNILQFLREKNPMTSEYILHTHTKLLHVPSYKVTQCVLGGP